MGKGQLRMGTVAIHPSRHGMMTTWVSPEASPAETGLVADNTNNKHQGPFCAGGYKLVKIPFGGFPTYGWFIAINDGLLGIQLQKRNHGLSCCCIGSLWV